MTHVNLVVLTGRLTRDVELRKISEQTSVARIGLAVSERFKNREGQWSDRTCFVEVEVWGKSAENCERYLEKGSLVLVEGKLLLSRWQTESGESRSKLKVRADRVQFLSFKRDREAEPALAVSG